jgi:hypothetical protein
LAVLDFTQPMDYEPFRIGTHGLHRLRVRKANNASEELTKWS